MRTIPDRLTSVRPPKRTIDYLSITYYKLKAGMYIILHLKKTREIRNLKRQHQGIQLKMIELLKVTRAIEEFESCKMLIFGLGNDSAFWKEANSSGKTVFLEDYEPWFEKITSSFPELEAYKVSYPGNITQWRERMDSPEKLEMDLPPSVADHRWDVILVDGPRGNGLNVDIPGRMSSIYMASKLAGEGAYVFVHDAERSIESLYADTFLGADRLVEEVRGRARLLIYCFT